MNGRRDPAERRRRKAEALGDRVAGEIVRRRRSRAAGDRSIWEGLGMFGIVGWSVAIPTLIGIAVGIWLDNRLTGSISWTLTGLIVGILLGSLNAWYWVSRESRRR